MRNIKYMGFTIPSFLLNSIFRRIRIWQIIKRNSMWETKRGYNQLKTWHTLLYINDRIEV